MPLNQNWEIRSDLVNLTVPSNADQVNSFGFGGSGGAAGKANWSLGNSDLLYIYVRGFSAEMKVGARKMWGDNSLVTNGVPFP